MRGGRRLLLLRSRVAQAGGIGAVLALGLVNGGHHLLRLGDTPEGEVGVGRTGGVEVALADLEAPVEDGLVGVHVLHPVEPRLLDLPGDDAAAYLEALV